ncbi:hypothetical protein [Streptomyces sp. NPDC001880]
MVDEQEAVEFLLGSLGVLRTQNQAWPAKVGLDFVEGGLELPPLGVEGGQSAAGALPGSRIVVMSRYAPSWPAMVPWPTSCSPRPERGGRPNASTFAFVSGKSTVVPSIAASRQPR